MASPNISIEAAPANSLSSSSYYYYAGALLLALLFLLRRQRSPKAGPPSGPPALPIIGHLHLLKPPPVHRALTNLAARYGADVLQLRLGSRPVVLVSSAAAAEESFTTHDALFVNRPAALSDALFSYNLTTIFSARYGPHWRNLRRLAAVELFSPARLTALSSVRTSARNTLLRGIFRSTTSGGDADELGFRRVGMRVRIETLTYNVVAEMLMGKRYRISSGVDKEEGEEEEARELRRTIHEVTVACGLNVADMMPFLKIFGWPARRHWPALHRKVDGLMQQAIDRRRYKQPGDEEKTLVDVMLEKQQEEPGQFTDDIIKGVIQDFLLAGTDTSAVAIEWALTLLLNHPEVLAEAEAEVREQVGYKRMVAEADLPNLPYIHCIVQETLRLYPSLPILPHESSADCTLLGVPVRRGTMVWMNLYGIQRDPKVWPEPSAFRPERFLEEEKGYKHVPFGSGRRRCPGESLAWRNVPLGLAALIQCFEWGRVGGVPVDVSESSEFTIFKAQPLEAVARPRKEMISFLSQL